jgi:microcystin-dependent protein
MAKTKVSEWNSNPSSNSDVGGIDINEGCAPSGINNAIREVMAQIKDMQTGADDDNFTVGGNLTVDGTTTLTGITTFATTPSFPAGAGLVPSGCILMWSGSIASIPSGWYLCDGTNSTPDLRNRFVVGAGSTYAVGATGGSADAIVVSHTHSITDPGHAHTANFVRNASGNFSSTVGTNLINITNTNSATTGITVDSTGSSGTNANLPPYYALCYIQKA